jgi:hypothetical protein
MSFKKLLSVVCLLALVGCASQGPTVRVTIAGGRKLVVSMKDGRIEGEEHNNVKVATARYMYNMEKKQGGYVFALVFSDGLVPASLTVEDVSDLKVETLVQEQPPVLKEQAWFHACPFIGINDPSMRWMHDIDDSFRIYRFTAVLQDGRKIIFHYASVYPGYAKASLIGAIEAEAKKGS